MTIGDLGPLLQGIGSILLALTTGWLGLRAANVLRMRVEGPVHWHVQARESRR